MLLSMLLILLSATLALPEARAPFARGEFARREVETLTFDYRTGSPWNQSKKTYPWAEFVAGEKSVLLAGSDPRVAGLRDGGAGFGHVVLYAGKSLRRNPGSDILGEIRFRIKDGGPWNEQWPTDHLRVYKARNAVEWTRPWSSCGTNGVFRYAARPKGPGCVEIAWDVGVDDSAWKSCGLARRIDMYLDLPPERPSAQKDAEGVWELNASDPTRHVSVKMSPNGPRGRVEIDLHESSTLLTPLHPPTGGCDFWANDAYDVPARPGRNLLPNGGFEQGLKGWCLGTSTPFAELTNHPGDRLVRIVSEARFGRHALYLGNCKPCPSFVSAPLPLVPGKTYTVSFWGKSDRDRGGGVAFGVKPAGNFVRQPVYTNRVDRSGAVMLTKKWERHALSFIASEQGARICFWPWQAPLYIDGVVVEEGEMETETVSDPVEAEFVTADEFNALRYGNPIAARLCLTGRPMLTGRVRVEVANFYDEQLSDGSHSFDLDETGCADVPLPELDRTEFGTGVFIVRLTYEAEGKCWRDYARFSIVDPVRHAPPVTGLFAHFPWFIPGGAYMFCLPCEYAGLMGSRMTDWGIGATSWRSNGEYARGPWASWYRKFGIVNKLHLLQVDLRERHPDRFGWGKPGLAAFTNAAPEELSFIEREAYRSAKEADPTDVYWTYSNEEELWHPLVKARDFDTYFKYQHACFKGLARGFAERGMKFYFAPTHGTSAYCHPSSYVILDGYLSAAQKAGFKYTCISVHTYHAIDGSILGGGDRAKGAEHLLERLKAYGYSENVPILFPEGFNILPMHIPEWGAKDWADCYHGTIPVQSLGLRESLQAGALARIYLMDFKLYPRLKVIHPWIAKPVLDLALTPYCFTKVMNTLAHLLPDPRFVGEARPFPDIRGYCYRPKPEATDGVLGIWTSNNEVERGLRKGDVLTMNLPRDATFIDLMGNPRRPTPSQREGSSIRVPLTPYPLFIRSQDPEALLAALRTATGGTARVHERKTPMIISVGRTAATPVDWNVVRTHELTNCVSGDVRADLRLVRQGTALVCRVEVADVTSATVDFAFDGLGDARATDLVGVGPDDCSFRVENGRVTRTREVNTQFRDGGATGCILTTADVERDIRTDIRSENGTFVCVVEFPQRHLSPVRMEEGVRFGMDVVVKTHAGSAALAASSEPRDYPLIIFKDGR